MDTNCCIVKINKKKVAKNYLERRIFVRKKDFFGGIVVFLLVCGGATSAMGKNFWKGSPSSPGLNPIAPRPARAYKVHNIGTLWSWVSNFGNYGDPNSQAPSYDWPGGTHNYYLWEGRFWFGAVVGSDTLVSHADYGNYELDPSETEPPGWPGPIDGWGVVGPEVSMWDINSIYDDWSTVNNYPLGVQVQQRALAWSIEPYDNFIIYEYKLTYDGRHGDTLHSFFVSWVFDCDVGGSDPSDPHIDDLVSFDGDTRGDWVKFG